MEDLFKKENIALYEANESCRELLFSLLPEWKEKLANHTIKERIQILEDACRELGEDNHLMK